MIETRADETIVNEWCANCVYSGVGEYCTTEVGALFCMNCRKADGEAPSNYVAVPIKDSGERTEFETGAVRDLHEGKGRFDLLPLNAVWAVAKHCERGALKYGEHNVDKGIPVHSLFDSAIRHAFKWFIGWDDEPHLEAACWNLLWALEMCLTKPEMDDRPREGNDGCRWR